MMQMIIRHSKTPLRHQLTAVLAALTLLSPLAAQATELELERVVLSAGGVGYFEYEGQVSGDVVLPVDIRLDQVDDVLKSLVIYDGRGRLGRVTMPGKAPLDVAFRDLPFSQASLGSMPALLNALTGAEITIEGDQRVTGRIVNVTQEQGHGGSGASFTQHRVNLLTERGLVSEVLEQSGQVTFTDQALQAQINRALLAIAENRRQDRRQLDVNLFGDGERDIRLGYVVAAPLWKSSYRLSVTENDDGKGQLTGWAILENMSGQDWDEVELVVTSGNPVTFRQALYESYFVDRPAIPVEVLGRVLPPVDGGAVAFDAPEDLAPLQQRRLGRAEIGGFAADSMMANNMRMAGAPAMAELSAPMEESIAQAAMVAAESQEAATQVIFRYPEPVSVTSGSSIMLPIISNEVSAEQVALFNPSTHATHPLASVKLTNDGETSLPPGVVTLYSTATTGGPANFAGDAQLSPLPAGDSRLLSFALDQSIKVVTDAKFTEQRVGGSIVDGIFRLNVNQLSETVYKIENTQDRDRTVILEHAKQPGWGLQTEVEDTEETNAAFRIPVTVEAGDSVEFPVVLERPIVQRYELTSIDGNLIASFASARTLSDELREVMANLAQYKQAVENRRRVVDGLQSRLNQQSEDQERVRRLLTSVPRDSDLYRRYLSDLDRQEDIVQRLQTERYEADEALREAEGELLAYARSVEIKP